MDEQNTNTQTAQAVIEPVSELKPNVDIDHPEAESVIEKAKAVEAEPVEITITLPTNAYFVSGIRDFTMRMVQNMTGFSEQWAYRFQSVVDELTNNAIEFGSTKGEKIEITFKSLQGKFIEIWVKDSGTGPSKKKAEEMKRMVQERQANFNPKMITSIRGRGLAQIVANWTDTMEFIDNPDGGLTVHVVKNLEQGEQE